MSQPREGPPTRRLPGAFFFSGNTSASLWSSNLSRSLFLRFLIVTSFLTVASFASAQEPSRQTLDHQFHQAASDYEAGNYQQAASRLEPLLPYATKSFEVHELLGLVYAGLRDEIRAEKHLKLAVQIAPNSVAGRTNFGAFLMQSGKRELAAEQFKRALQLEPGNYDANHDLAELLIQAGQIGEAQPYLLKAQIANPESYENGYDLVLAEYTLGKLKAARQIAQKLLEQHNTAELHNLLGKIEEKDGQFVDAAKEFEVAAHLDPTEDNLFDWGSEMLLHRTYDPAIEIFKNATERYPKSPRLFIGLGLSNYFRGQYDEAVKALLQATDLNPSDPRAYVFLSKAYDSSPTQADDVIERFRHFAELKPNDGKAQYYYAISLWKGKRTSGTGVDLGKVEELLKKAIQLDDTLADAHVELGDLYSGEHKYEQAISQYTRALQLDPDISDAHYRLGTNYVHVGKKDEAQKEFAIYQKLRAQHLENLAKERAEVQQFIFSETNAGAVKP
ncbi:MAG: tetratricopeptide repeat protein [Acidobacteriota bacterium]|nr:tetratricopeptide repeat protein [Acidobacteriota bacterium]